MTSRVLITGIGVLSGLGPGRQAMVHGLRHGLCGIVPLAATDTGRYASGWAAQILDPIALPPLEQALPGYCTRTERLALAAAAEALAEAALPPSALERVAVVIGSGGGADLHTPGDWDRPPSSGVYGERLVRQHPGNAANLVARCLLAEHLAVPLSVMTACSSSALAVGFGLDLLRLGRADVVLAGGCEALSPLTLGGFSALKALDPERCRPFHQQRAGLTLGEAAAVLVLQSDRVPLSAAPYAEVAGYGASCDAHHQTSPQPQGHGALTAMRAAAADASIAPASLGYINAHGTGTPLNDAAESKAIRALLGDAVGSVAISSTKGATGHTLAAAGALEIAACALALRHEFYPPTLRLDLPDPACADLDLIGVHARDGAFDVAMSNSFAFGGHNVSVVLRRPG